MWKYYYSTTSLRKDVPCYLRINKAGKIQHFHWTMQRWYELIFNPTDLHREFKTIEITKKEFETRSALELL